MSGFLIQTLLWTGALIALVLVSRRPVARHFGPRAAYALWALPALRLAMPPLVLPAWLASKAEPLTAVSYDTLAPASYGVEIGAGVSGESVPATSLIDIAALPSTLLLAIWLIGAAAFLVHRFALYFRMRRELLDRARPVGEVQGVRLVETAATAGPLAFGVIDKVVALPPGFMAARDRRTRDLAIAHELAHHRGRDLLVNFLIQPLFALHWFNPLGRMGWDALRRDQEAACDARVVARCDREARAAYADVIAGFATSALRIEQGGAVSRLALAAPMACPVLGDKSIIHRLRTLTMTEISRRRRIAGKALLLGGALALPLTASVSYAESVAQAPQVPAPPSVPAPPAPTTPGAGPEVPQPPAPPLPPEIGEDFEAALDSAEDALDQAQSELRSSGAAKEGTPRRVVRITREVVDGKKTSNRVIFMDGEPLGLSAEKRAEMQARMAEMRAKFAKDGDMRRDIRIALAETQMDAPRIVMACSDERRQTVTERRDADGRRTLFVCQTTAIDQARESLVRARKAIEIDRNLSADERAEALRSVDQAIAEMKSIG